jgi:hypothetical protein
MGLQPENGASLVSGWWAAPLGLLGAKTGAVWASKAFRGFGWVFGAGVPDSAK